MNLYILLLLPHFAYGSPEIEDAKRSVQTLIRPLLATGAKASPPKSGDHFRIDECQREKINWMDLLLMKKEVTINYTFKKGCDIQGTIQPKVFQTFPVTLQLRNIQSYNKAQAVNRITAQFEKNPILNLEIREGVLSGKQKVKFEADYKVEINPMKKNPIERNLGGTIRISEINGKKVEITEKILIK